MSQIGIDIGNSYIKIGIFRNGGVDIIQDEAGNRKFPTMIAFTEKERFIGDSAKNQATFNTKNTIYDILRMTGRQFSDPLFQKDMELWPFKVVQGEKGRPQVEVEWKRKTSRFYPEELLSMILIRVKIVVEKQIHQKITDAYFTFPAYFNITQLESLRYSLNLAGIKPLGCIPSPVGAALTFDFNHKYDSEINLLVFDFGSSSLDASIIAIDGGMIEVRSSVSQPHFGGEDIDNKMVNYFAYRFQQKHKKDLRKSQRSIMLLKKACERAKHTLSISPTASVTCESILDGIDLVDNITREEFEQLNIDYFQMILNPIASLLQQANCSKDDITEILLFGGSSRIPRVCKLLSGFFEGKKLSKGVDFEEASAYGAAMLAAMRLGDVTKSISSTLLLDVLQTSLGFAGKDDKMINIVTKDTTIPAKKSVVIENPEIDSDGKLEIKIFDGENNNASKNNLLVTHTFGPVSKDDQIEVTFDVDFDRNLQFIISNKKDKKDTFFYRPDIYYKEGDGFNRKLAELAQYEKDDDELNNAGDARNRLEGYLLSVLDSLPNIQRDVNDALYWIDENNDANSSEFEQRMRELEARFTSFLKGPK